MSIQTKDKLITLESLGIAFNSEANTRSTADDALENKIGTLSGLNTTSKIDLVSAINEVDNDVETIKADLDTALSTADIYYYAKYGGFTGTAIVDSTTRAYVTGIPFKRFRKFKLNLPSTIQQQSTWQKINDTWTSIAGTIVDGYYTVPDGIEDFIIIFRNKQSASNAITATELANIYLSPVDEAMETRLSTIETGLTTASSKISTLESEIEDALLREIPVEHGGFAVNNNQMVESADTTRAKTDICETSMYGSYINVSLPSTLMINTVYVYDGSTWTIASGSLTDYDFGTNEKFRLSFKNITDPTATISQSELESIKITPKYSDYFNTALPGVASWYTGKKYVALGDSITYGFIPRNSTGYPGQLDSYAKLAAQKLGMTFANYGISGNTLAAYTGISNPMSVRYTELPNDANVITVMGGTNDIRYSIPVGTMEDRTNDTFYGALHVLLSGLYKKYFIDQGTTTGEEKKIIVCTPIKLLQSYSSTQGGTGTLKDFSAYCTAIKEVAAYYSFPVLDFQNLSGINPHLNETVHGTEEGYTGYYNPYITDGTHPTQEGQEIMSNVLVGFLRSLA